MSETREFEAVIVGAGLTGATLALALAQAGLSVAVVDAGPLDPAPDADQDVRASAIASASWRQWRALSVAQSLEDHAQPIRAMVISDIGGLAGASLPALLRFDADDAPGGSTEVGEPLGWMVENRHIRAALQAALTRADVAVYAPAKVVACDTDGRLATVRLDDGESLQAPVVVGSDGWASRVRQSAGISVNGWSYGQAGLSATVALDTPHEGVARQVFLPGGPLAILPLTGDRASVVWTERSKRASALMQASPQAFEAHLARRFGDALGRACLVSPRRSYPLRLQIAEAMTARRVALVGDAAHIIHPLAGQGLNMGLKDVAALAQVLVDARRVGEDLGGAAVLDRYARWRRFDAASLALTTDLLNRLFSNANPALRALRGAGLALVDRIGPAKRLFIQDAGAELGDLPRLLRGEAL